MASQTNVRNERPVSFIAVEQKSDGFFAREDDLNAKTAMDQSFFDLAIKNVTSNLASSSFKTGVAQPEGQGSGVCASGMRCTCSERQTLEPRSGLGHWRP